MAIVKNVELQGNKVISTLNGAIELNQNTGELIIRKQGNVLTRVNSQGFIYSDNSGLRRILMGAHPTDGRIGDWVSKPTIDVITELSIP